MLQDLPEKVKGAFYVDCNAVLSNMMIPRSARTALEMQQYTQAELSGMATIYCFSLCFYLAFIRGLPQCEAIVKRVNTALQQGFIEEYLDHESTQWQAPQLRRKMLLRDLVVTSTKMEVGSKMCREMERQYGVDEEKRSRPRGECARCQDCLLHGRGEDIKVPCDIVESVDLLATID